MEEEEKDNETKNQAFPVTDSNSSSLDDLIKYSLERYKEEIVVRTGVRTKASVLIGAILATIGAYAKIFLDISSKSNIGRDYIIMVVLTISFLVTSFIYFVKVYRGSKYHPIRADRNLLINNWAKKESTLVKELILEEISVSISKYAKQNSKKESEFNLGILFFFISILSIFVLLFASVCLPCK